MAMFPKESVGEEVSFWVDVIDNHVGIASVTSSENHKFEILSQFLQALVDVGSHIYCYSHNLLIWEHYGQKGIMGGW